MRTPRDLYYTSLHNTVFSSRVTGAEMAVLLNPITIDHCANILARCHKAFLTRCRPSCKRYRLCDTGQGLNRVQSLP